MTDRLTQRSFSALRWGYAGFLTRGAAGFASGLVLARLLGPKPFGQVAAAALVFGLANQLADGGFNLALVQAPQLSDADVRFAFTFQLAAGAVLTVSCALAAPWIAEAFRDPVITTVLRLTALLFTIQAFGLVSTALLKRQLAFRRLQAAQIGSYLLGYAIVGIAAALLGWGVWSLVVAQLVQSAAYSIAVFVQVRHSVLPCFRKESLHLAGFGLKVTGANIINWSLSNFDNAFIGRAFGSGALGLYSRAFNTVSTPADAIVGTWQQVLFASCSRAADRTPALRRAYLASLSAITLITLPIFWSVAACSHAVVGVLYGKLWAGVAPLLPPLAIAVTINAAMALAGPILSAVNQVKYEVKAQLISLIVAVVAFLIAARYSAVAMAWAVLGVYCARFFFATRPTLRLLDLGWIHVLRATRGSLVLACFTAGVVWESDRIARDWGFAPVPALIIVGLAGVIAASIVLKFAGDHVLSPELVAFLIQVSPSLPRALSLRLERIAARQAVREAMRNDSPSAAETSSEATKLFVATMMAPRGDTGVQTHFTEFRRELEHCGIATEVLTPFGTPKVLRVAAGAVRRVVELFNVREAALYTEMRLNRTLLWCALARRLPRKRAWTVYAQCPQSAMAAMRLRKRDHQTVVMVVHFNRSQGEEMADRGWISRGGAVDRDTKRIEKKTLLGADRVVYCSRFMRSFLTSRFSGLADRPHVIIPNFVRLPTEAQEGPSGDIITIGTVEPRKNQQAILRIIAEARERGKVYQLTIVGSGELDSELKTLASELGISAQVTFAGYMENASRLLPRHRLYVHAAKVESFGIVLIEAFSAGLPVLAPAVGGIPEILTDGAEGFFWDTNDAKASATKLIAVLEDEPLRSRMGATAFATYNARFRSDRVAQQLYRFVTGEGGESQELISSVATPNLDLYLHSS